MQSLAPAHFEKLILNDGTLAPLWFAHCVRHGGVAAAEMALSQWRSRFQSEFEQNAASRALDLRVLAFHYQFARNDFTACRQTCDQAEQLIAGGTPGIGSRRHPLGVASEDGKNRTLRRLQRSQWPELARADLGAAAPEVIAGQVDVLPAERRQVLQQRVIDCMAVAP